MAKLLSDKADLIISYIKQHPVSSSKEIYDALGLEVSHATFKRGLQGLVSENLITASGKLKGTKYEISQTYDILRTLDVEEYFKKEIDERVILKGFNYTLINETLTKVSLFSKTELEHLNDLQKQYTKNSSKLSEAEFKNELERLAVDLSWKSSQIEGHT